jgi:hypothetical protein
MISNLFCAHVFCMLTRSCAKMSELFQSLKLDRVISWPFLFCVCPSDLIVIHALHLSLASACVIV